MDYYQIARLQSIRTEVCKRLGCWGVNDLVSYNAVLFSRVRPISHYFEEQGKIVLMTVCPYED